MISRGDFKKTVKKYSETDCNHPYSTEYLDNISKMFRDMPDDEE